VTNKKSFEHLSHWLGEIQVFTTNEDVVKLLVGNKIDKEDERQVSREEAVNYARSKEMLFIECSAKTRFGIQQTFEELVQKILDTPNLWESVSRDFLKVHRNEQPCNC